MKKVLLILALGLLTITSCEKEEDFTCECYFVKDPYSSTFYVGGRYYASGITDCNREGEMVFQEYYLRCN
jgi:hypothetical protein